MGRRRRTSPRCERPGARDLTVLYIVDRLAGMGAVFAAVSSTVSHTDPRRGPGTLVEGVLTGLAVAGFLVEVVATRRSAASRARA